LYSKSINMDAIKTKGKLEFDIFKTLYVIEHDKDLNDIFRDDTDISYNLLRTLAKQDKLPINLLERAQEIFERIICKNKKPLGAYNKITAEDIDAESKLPKHYGKKRILQDIQANNNKTELDRAMLALNDMRNLYSKLKGRCIKDKINGTRKLTRNDCRDIVATVRIVENKLAKILEK